MAWAFRICHYADIAEKVGQAASNVRPKRQRVWGKCGDRSDGINRCQKDEFSSLQ